MLVVYEAIASNSPLPRRHRGFVITEDLRAFNLVFKFTIVEELEFSFYNNNQKSKNNSPYLTLINFISLST